MGFKLSSGRGALSVALHVGSAEDFMTYKMAPPTDPFSLKWDSQMKPLSQVNTSSIWIN